MFSMGWIESGQKVTQVKLPITGPLCQVLLEHLYTDLEAIPNRYNFLREIDFSHFWVSKLDVLIVCVGLLFQLS